MSGAVEARKTTIVRVVAAAAGIAVLVGALAPAAVAQRKRPPVRRVGIQVQPQAIVAGQAANVSGRLQGTAPGGKSLILLSAVFPFQTFSPGPQTNSDRQARYHYRVSPRVNTRYQVVSRTQPPVASEIVALTVAQRVDVNVSDSTPRKRHNVYFSGSVTPANPGATVYIQRQSVNTGRFRTISRTVLADAGADHSDFRKKVRITRSAVYAVRVRSTLLNAQGFSPPLPLRVH